MILRVILFVILLFLCAFAPLWVCAVALVCYALRYTAYELIILAVCLDVLYGMQLRFSVPYYTLVVLSGLIIIESIKPHIWVYNQ